MKIKKDQTAKTSLLIACDLLTNYLTTNCRHILKSKVNFCFKVCDLTMALSSLMMIIIYVSYHLSFDRYHDDYKDIYRVNSEWMENGAMTKYALVPKGIGPTLNEVFPEIESFVRIQHRGQNQIWYQDRIVRSYGFIAADTSVFDIFKFDFLRGDESALARPGSVVLTNSLAEQIFGSEDPLHKTISFSGKRDQPLEVTAIIEDMPVNSHLYIKGIFPLNALLDSWDLERDPWEISIDGSTSLYVKLGEHGNPKDLPLKAAPFLRKNLTKGEDGLEESYTISLQPLKDIHLDPWIYADFTQKANSIYVYVFSLLGIFLLLIAGINYVNLSIADFHKRNKEIGVRKVLGACKRQVAFQIIFETCLICFTALILGLGIVYLLFPQVVQVLDSNLSFEMLLSPPSIAIVAIVAVFLIMLASLYPAWSLAANKPVNDFKSLSGFGKNSSSGNILLLVQFTISIICIWATSIVGQQIHFFETKDPGYNRKNTVVLFMPDSYPSEKIPVIKDELSKVPGVAGVSYSTFLIVGGYYRDRYRVEIDGEMKQMLLNEVFFDYDFFRTMGIELVAGRSFDPDNAADAHSALIVNEAAVREFGWEDPIGKKINYGYEEADGEKWEGTVIGVVEDFNVYSMRTKIEPLVMRLPWSDWPGNCVYIKISGPLHETISRIEKKYNEILPDFLIDYHLIGELYDNQYQNEQKAFTSLQFGTWIIVIISCLGIFSLSVYMSIRRMKEFGIRKVLGASVRQISFLHVGHFLRIAFIANLVALPIAYWMMQKWLSEFAYRTDLNAVLFIGVTMISFLLVIISAGYASWKAGVMNPVDVIKNGG